MLKPSAACILPAISWGKSEFKYSLPENTHRVGTSGASASTGVLANTFEPSSATALYAPRTLVPFFPALSPSDARNIFFSMLSNPDAPWPVAVLPGR